MSLTHKRAHRPSSSPSAGIPGEGRGEGLPKLKVAEDPHPTLSRNTGRGKIRRLLAVTLSGVLALPPAALAQEKPAPRIAAEPNKVRGDEINDRQKAAVEKGLAWLARKQQGDGTFNIGLSGYSNHAGITALAGLAFMQAGNLPGRGNYGKEAPGC